ncbi:hypothetical protein OVS_02905 [Mycoplasma ovis str. Michigan]|uniref:Uncharacterized protein n=1 Tax=Mycoplasma ovis str. Michigan TaxID=1415773 RepID=A0ABN4BM64_9MOLU|nr:hypothetical protein [Mycoplasma ovis]AHC40371.1 hypothetical protein OVS_02905 [Mycoplasma ovis str. Michigan]
MNIFFKLFSVVGLVGTIGGATYLAKQDYTNRSSATTSRSSGSKNGQTVDIKRQPTMGEEPEKKEEKSQ